MKRVIKLFIMLLFIFVFVFVFVLTGCSEQNIDKQNNIQEEPINNKQNEEINESVNRTQETHIEKNQIQEEELSSFSTKLLAKEENRVSNISKACSTINGTVINSGETFSFWGIIGNPTIEKGYKEAKAFTAAGEVTTAIGGGVCQVSSTIYNVVLNVPELEAIERHEHTREVYYVELGNDASVSYGGADFKFKNNLETPIKIYAECMEDSVNIRFVKLV